MNTIFTDAATGHDNEITGQRLLVLRGLTVDLLGHNTDGAAEHQRLSGKTIIKIKGAIHRGDPALIASMFHPFPYTLKNTFRMQQAGRDLFIVKRGGKTEHIGIADELCPHTGTKRIAVYPDNAGKSSTIWVKS